MGQRFVGKESVGRVFFFFLHFRMGGAMGVVKGWGVNCIFMLTSRSGDMNVCKKKYKSNMIQTDFVNIHDIYDVDKSQLNVTFVKICIC